MSLYEILEVSPDAKTGEIRAAYRRLALKHHPDATGQPDSSLFRQIQAAYEVLSDPARRADYDRSRRHTVPVHIEVPRTARPFVEPLSPWDPYLRRSAFPRHLNIEELRFRQTPVEDLTQLIDFILRRF